MLDDIWCNAFEKPFQEMILASMVPKELGSSFDNRYIAYEIDNRQGLRDPFENRQLEETFLYGGIGYKNISLVEGPSRILEVRKKGGKKRVAGS
jgi:hypothetical protein